MTPQEAAQLLTVCAGIDNRKPSAETARLWAAMLNGLPYAACERAVLAHYAESREWIMPADIRNRVRRDRAAAITHDEALELPPHDPDDTGLHVRLLIEARANAAEGRTYQPQGLVRRNLRSLGGPVRRVNELDDAERAAGADRARALHREALTVLAAVPEPQPPARPVFACEVIVDGQLCGDPAPHLSTDRRKPLCDQHQEPTDADT